MSKPIMTATGPLLPPPLLRHLVVRTAAEAAIAYAQGDNGFWYTRIEDLEAVSERLCLEQYQEVKRFATFLTYNDQGREARAHWNGRLGAGREQHVHFTTNQQGYEGTWAIYDLGLAFASYVDRDFAAHINSIYRQVTTGLVHADESPVVPQTPQHLDLDAFVQMGQAIAGLAQHAKIQGQELALVKRDMGEIKEVAAQAFTLAQHVMETQDYTTIETYIARRKLTRQLPPGKPQENFGIWLTGYCVRQGIQVRDASLVGRTYEKVNAYPVGVIDATLEGYLKNVYGQGQFNFGH